MTASHEPDVLDTLTALNKEIQDAEATLLLAKRMPKFAPACEVAALQQTLETKKKERDRIEALLARYLNSPKNP